MPVTLCETCNQEKEQHVAARNLCKTCYRRAQRSQGLPAVHNTCACGRLTRTRHGAECRPCEERRRREEAACQLREQVALKDQELERLRLLVAKWVPPREALLSENDHFRVVAACADTSCPRQTGLTHPFCGPCTTARFHVEVRPSTWPGAAYGLFVAGRSMTPVPFRPRVVFRAGDTIGVYGGPVLNKAEVDELGHAGSPRLQYVLEARPGLFVDSSSTTAGYCRFINESVQLANCKFAYETTAFPAPEQQVPSRSKKVTVKALRDLYEREELWLDYGRRD